MLLEGEGTVIPGRGRWGGVYGGNDMFVFFIWMLLKIGPFLLVKMYQATYS